MKKFNPYLQLKRKYRPKPPVDGAKAFEEQKRLYGPHPGSEKRSERLREDYGDSEKLPALLKKPRDGD